MEKELLFKTNNIGKIYGSNTVLQGINVEFKATNRELIMDYEYNRVDAAITRSASAGQYQTGLTNLNIAYRTRQLETLLLNHNASAYPLNDERIRKAIRYAIDFDAIAYKVYMGTVQRTDTPLPSGTWMYRDNDAAFTYNPDKARQLLETSGRSIYEIAIECGFPNSSNFYRLYKKHTGESPRQSR